MNRTSPDTQRSRRDRPLVAGIAILGLLAGLLGLVTPVFANDTVEDAFTTSLGSHPNPCPARSTAYKLDFEMLADYINDQGDLDSSWHEYTSDDGVFSVELSVTSVDDNDEVMSLAFRAATPTVVQITTKAGSEQSTEPYESQTFSGGAASGGIGPRNDGKSISFIIACVGAAQQTTTPPTTSVATTQAVQGGTGTPRGGVLANTSADSGVIPGALVALSALVLVGSLAALVVPALARRRSIGS